MPRTTRSPLRAPRRWLGLSFLGVWMYFASQLSQAYAGSFADGAGLSLDDASLVLRVASNFGQILFFAGIVAALWRANRAAGVSAAGVRGLVLGSVGVSMLVMFEVVLLAEWYEIALIPWASAEDFGLIGGGVGVALGLAGIASLAVGLTRATGLFGRPARNHPRTSEAGTPPSDPGSRSALERTGDVALTEGR